jgi:hypothetical protein
MCFPGWHPGLQYKIAAQSAVRRLKIPANREMRGKTGEDGTLHHFSKSHPHPPIAVSEQENYLDYGHWLLMAGITEDEFAEFIKVLTKGCSCSGELCGMKTSLVK